MTRLEQAGVRMLMDDKVLRSIVAAKRFRHLDRRRLGTRHRHGFAAPAAAARTEACGLRDREVQASRVIRTSAAHDQRPASMRSGPVQHFRDRSIPASIDAQAEALSATLLAPDADPDPRPLPCGSTRQPVPIGVDGPTPYPRRVARKANRGGVTFLFHDRRGQLRASFSRQRSRCIGTAGSQKTHGLLNPAAATSYGIPCTDAAVPEPGTGWAVM